MNIGIIVIIGLIMTFCIFMVYTIKTDDDQNGYDGTIVLHDDKPIEVKFDISLEDMVDETYIVLKIDAGDFNKTSVE